MRDARTIEPGATLGVFGGGQLGRMFAAAAARMGYRVHVFDPQRDCPAAHVAAEHTCAPFDDDEAVLGFAQRCDAVTIEFENIPARCLNLAGRHTPARPGPAALAIAQDRLAERVFLDRHGLPTAAHAPVGDAESARRAVERIGAPGVLKAARGGYDGRGQVRIDQPDDVEHAWQKLGVDHALYEAWVAYDKEISVLVARSPRGQVEAFGPIENHHARHILDWSIAPARLDDDTAERARAIARRIAGAAMLEGVICVEMFAMGSGELLINELAPRPHNSGHLTIEACTTSQFEQQVRAMCNLPLGVMTPRRGAAMANLLGDLWADGEPDWAAALSIADVALHLYGKDRARPGRKMGHLTATAATAGQALDAVLRARHRAGRSDYTGRDEASDDAGAGRGSGGVHRADGLARLARDRRAV